jgi:hypothetical protein
VEQSRLFLAISDKNQVLCAKTSGESGRDFEVRQGAGIPINHVPGVAVKNLPEKN